MRQLLTKWWQKVQCARLGGKFSSYIDGALSSRERESVEKHLASCSRCQQELASLRKTVGLLHHLPSASPHRSFALGRGEPARRRAFHGKLGPALATTLVILVLAIIASPLFTSGMPLTLVRSLSGYVALVPQTLYAGEEGAVSFNIWREGSPASSNVEVSLLKEGKLVFQTKGAVAGRGNVRFQLPDLAEGQYELEVKGIGFQDKTTVTVEKNVLLFLQTDKPIYKPGQTVHIRVITLNSELRPVSQSTTVEALDAKGIKIFRQTADTDEYGMATLDLPLSTEPNLGVWKIVGAVDKISTSVDIRVEKYVLPKYEIKVELPKEWFLANEPISGTITAEYSFGKPVTGKLIIKASRYVGAWEKYATFSAEIDGETEFSVPAAGYVAGVPAAQGMGNVLLDIVVKESSTGYEEKVNRLLTIASSSINLQIIPESAVFKPTLPFSFLVITETPDNKPVDKTVQVKATYLDKDFQEKGTEEQEVQTQRGKAQWRITPPEGSVALTVNAQVVGASVYAYQILQSGYSPSGNFIHVEQISPGIPRVGEEVKFQVFSTREAANFYYEVVSRGKVVFSDFTRSNEISFITTPMMTPSAKLLVYQILPNSEVAADYIPFEVEAQYPHIVKAEFSQKEAKPGEEVDLDVETEGEARVGLVAVDRSVYILAQNRLNLQQVFAELERLYMQPQAEFQVSSFYDKLVTQGAKDIFAAAGVTVLSNQKVPEGKDYPREGGFWGGVVRLFGVGAEKAGIPEALRGTDMSAAEETSTGLAEVQRVRQFFPETWLWQELTTDSTGKALVKVVTPDTITTWQLQAVAVSKEKGLGVAEAELQVFQPFFAQIDLPYSAIRGEEFPVKVAVYNYLDEPQEVRVEIEPGDWFELLDSLVKTVETAASDIGSAEFKIRPTKLGTGQIKVTARSQEAADALIKSIVILPEGVEREMVDNFLLKGGTSREVSTLIPTSAVAGSGRAYIAVTASYLAQTIAGLDNLLQMPYGCGEQNMLLVAPDVYITKYLRETGQLLPQIMAKAEMLMVTGYQRELTYMHSDGSFSAFGESDSTGSLWLTAFVLKTFAQAQDLIYIDESMLGKAKQWIVVHQNDDGSFDTIGFVTHREMMGGVQGKDALTAFVAIDLREAGEENGSARAIDYLEGRLAEIDDPYTAALVAYALELVGSEKTDQAYIKLMELAQEDENGLHWGKPGILNQSQDLPEFGRWGMGGEPTSLGVEATAYATLALLQHGDKFNAGRAARWLVSQRNAWGGFSSTQDTVVALQALTAYSREARAGVDLRVTIGTGDGKRELTIGEENYDVLQIVEVPLNETMQIKAEGEGEVIVQVVKRFNLPEAEETGQAFRIKVDYDITEVEVNGLVTVSVELEFSPPETAEAGMVVLDVAVPTGFTPVVDSLEQAKQEKENIKRYDIAGRKVIFYLENMNKGDKLSFFFQIRAMYPVRTQSTTSQAYAYYQTEMRGETLSPSLTVSPPR